MKRLTKKRLVKFLSSWTGETEGKYFRVMTGKEGLSISEYSHGKWYIDFDGSALYDLFQGYPNWDFHTAFHEFLGKYGYWFEQGHAWNCNIIEEGGD